MKKAFLITIIILVHLHLLAQKRTISGRIHDYQNNEVIEGVRISHSFSDTVIYTNKKGKFRFGSSPKHTDTLFISHPEYKSTNWVIKENKNIIFHRIRLLPNNLSLDTILNYGYKDTRIIGGVITDGYTNLRLSDAEIIIDSLCYALSNKLGEYSAVVPSSTLDITIRHPLFENSTVTIKPSKLNNSRIHVELDRKIFEKEDTVYMTKKNLVGYSVNELINGSIGVRYQRFINGNHAVGIHNSFYLFGKGYNFGTSDNKFSGIKVAPYYRMYFSRIKKKGGFLEAKLIAGYFDYSKIWYGHEVDDRDGQHFKESFSTYGFGFGGGYFSFLPHNINGVFDVYVGFQYMPMNVPETQFGDKYQTDLYISRGGWYYFGPGSIVEIKFIFSGLF